MEEFRNLKDLTYKRFLLYFYTDSCAKCKLMEKDLTELASQIKIIKINASKNHDVCKKYGIMSVPSFIYFNDNKYDIKQGIINKNEILKWIGC